ncbi:TPA: hypothetical protein HA336_01010 [Methanopyrus kandleri]|uniref:Uncharacterized protein specific for M.kandleri, MK-8 family n=2 Tax=Methanopyrus kandleri TaxID=2320 RepID=Q8TWR0_METKA|nr:hypothetical protein [Methanopyrus kandleri]AAM02185.1 Uncharacterized protein specific for M.kandleri, MK-8 family [Methanopyrus kandleri AV19]HII69796.1 hypothetical protein [Methanopyrus kandleri]
MAVFHYPHCENTASGITDVIKGHLGPNGAIEFVGVHGTSHSIAGLPEDVQKMEIQYCWEFLEDQGLGPYLRKDIISPSPEWIMDDTFVKVCQELGTREVVCGYRTWELDPDKHPRWYGKDYDYIADIMVIKKLNTNGYTVYVCPVIDFEELVGDVVDELGVYNLSNLKTMLRKAIETLRNTGAIRDGSHLMMWVLIHPWQLTEDIRVGRNDNTRPGMELIEEFIQWVKKGQLDYEVNGINIKFVLENPSDAIRIERNIEQNPTAYGHPMVTVTKLDWVSMIKASGGKTARELKHDHQKLVDIWERAMKKLQKVAPQLSSLRQTVDRLVYDVVLRATNEFRLSVMATKGDFWGTKYDATQYVQMWEREIQILEGADSGDDPVRGNRVGPGSPGDGVQAGRSDHQGTVPREQVVLVTDYPHGGASERSEDRLRGRLRGPDDPVSSDHPRMEDHRRRDRDQGPEGQRAGQGEVRSQQRSERGAGQGGEARGSRFVPAGVPGKDRGGVRETRDLADTESDDHPDDERYLHGQASSGVGIGRAQGEGHLGITGDVGGQLLGDH